MIPTRSSRPFGRVSPRFSDTDLARLIDRTVAMRIDAKREQGFAAVNVGCDGRKRTTMFDGSACQEAGEVCIAARQDGISACLNAPTQGNGLTQQTVVFTNPACAPVTGWWILDDDGYLYRVPAGLQTDYTYWPPSPLPDPVGYDFVRSGTWDRLMCAAALTPPVDNSDGGCEWVEFGLPGGETTIWLQQFRACVGGTLSYLETIPSLTGGTNKVTVGGFTGVWYGLAITNGAADVTLNQNDRNGNALTAGQEYLAILYAQQTGPTTMSVAAIKGVRATAGSAVLPVDPSAASHFALGTVTIPYGGTPVPVSTATTVPINRTDTRPLSAGISEGVRGRMAGILLRDVQSPNPGARVIDITLPAADGNVATGTARVAFGYPLAFEMYDEIGAPAAPYGCDTFAETAARDDYDMAYVYPPRLAVEYGTNHLNVCGPEIVSPDDSEILQLVSIPPTEIDCNANLIELPNGEIALGRGYTNSGSPVVPQRFERYQVRPAPTDQATFAVTQEALGTWPEDTNAWVAPVDHSVSSWTEHDTSFTLPVGSWTHGRPVRCVVWQSGSGQTHYTLDSDARYGYLGEPSGATCPVSFDFGDAPPRQGGTTCVVTVIGPAIMATYGWTFTYRDPVTGTEYESALSPIPELASAIPDPLTATYTRTITVPTGPTDTVRRTIYRFAYDEDDGRLGSTLISPWNALSPRYGSVYDIMTVQVGTIEDNSTAEFVDDQTTLSFSGVRPPEPLIPVGSGIVLEAPTTVVALAPLNL